MINMVLILAVCLFISLVVNCRLLDINEKLDATNEALMEELENVKNG